MAARLAHTQEVGGSNPSPATMNEVEAQFADILMEAPHAFTAGGVSYFLYPLSLGKLMLIQRVLRSLGMDGEVIAQWPIVEVIKTVATHREDCLQLIAYVTAKTKEECFSPTHILTIVGELSNRLTDEDIATLVVYILTSDKSDDVRKHYGIDEEQAAMAIASKAKSQGGSLSFGGRTLLGAVIDQACERYGWTLEYAVWGVSYASLRLMLADRISSIYLSEEERKNVPQYILRKDDDVIEPTKENMEQILSMDWR